MSQDSTHGRLRRLIHSIYPGQVPPNEAEEILREQEDQDPSLAKAARVLLRALEEQCNLLLELPPDEQRQKVAEIETRNSLLADLIRQHLGLKDPADVLRPAAPPGPNAPAMPPGYEFIRLLGQGGMGVVYLARHVALDRTVALKMIRRSLVDDLMRERFLTEARIIARMSHPGIVQIFEVGEFDGGPFLSLEFCSGGGLDQSLKGRQLPAREAAHLVRRLAEAVHVAHAVGIIHRDLKPANVLLAAVGQAGLPGQGVALASCAPKITDFGLARPFESAGQSLSGVIAGTPPYMAPEQAEAHKDLGPACDVYGLGAILYECLTGRPPFRGATVLDTLALVVKEKPAPPRALNPAVSADLEAVTLKCLEKEASSRYPSAQALADDLGRYLEGYPTLARPGNVADRAWKAYRRHPAAWSLFGGLVAAALVLLTVGNLALRASARAAQASEEKEKERSQRLEAERDGALKLAIKEKENREAEEKRSHERLIDGARSAAAAGNWKKALELYAQAAAGRRGDELTLEIERLPGYFLLHERKTIEDELNRLAEKSKAMRPEDAALLLLSRGDYLLSDASRAEEAQTLIRQAVETKLLGPADAAYARGLLSKQSGEAVPHFREAIQRARHWTAAGGKEIPRRHSRAHLALMATHLVRAEFDEAERRAEIVGELFPEDVVHHLIRGFVAMFRERYDECMAHVEKIRPQVSEERHRKTREFVQDLCDIHRLYVESEKGHFARTDLQLGAKQMKFMARTTADPPPIAFNIPVASWTDEVLAGVAKCLVAWPTFIAAEAASEAAAQLAPVPVPGETLPVKAMISQLKPASGVPCEMPILALLGRGHFFLARNAERWGNYKLAAKELEQASYWCSRAATDPTFLPTSALRYQAAVHALEADSNLLRHHATGKATLDPKGLAALHRRLGRGLEVAVRQGRQLPELRAANLGGLIRARRGQADVYNDLLLAWQTENREDLLPSRHRLRLLMQEKDHVAAFDLARRLLEREPKDAEFQKAHDEARKQVQKLVAEP